MLPSRGTANATSSTRPRSIHRWALLTEGVSGEIAILSSGCVMVEAMQPYSYHRYETNAISEKRKDLQCRALGGPALLLFQLGPDRHVFQKACQHWQTIFAD